MIFEVLIYNFIPGLIWPMESAHPILKVFNRFLPLSIASEIVGNLTLKGWPIQNPIIMRGLILSIIWLIILALPLYFFSLLKKNTWLKSK